MTPETAAVPVFFTQSTFDQRGVRQRARREDVGGERRAPRAYWVKVTTPLPPRRDGAAVA